MHGDKLEQDKPSQYSENMHIFLLLDIEGKAAERRKEGRHYGTTMGNEIR